MVSEGVAALARHQALDVRERDPAARQDGPRLRGHGGGDHDHEWIFRADIDEGLVQDERAGQVRRPGEQGDIGRRASHGSGGVVGKDMGPTCPPTLYTGRGPGYIDGLIFVRSQDLALDGVDNEGVCIGPLA